MPRAAKGPRLWREDRPGRKSIWQIRDDGGYKQSTGTEDRGKAEKLLQEYISAKHRPSGSAEPSVMTCGQALEIYGEEVAIHVTDPERIGYCIAALDPFWGDLTVSAITGPTCRRYVAHRAVSDGTIRRELGTLSAALNHCHVEGYLTSAPRVWLPEKPSPKNRWLTRREAAYLLRGARSLDRRAKHLQWFIILGLYSGGRRDAMLAARISAEETLHCGRLDPITKIYHRKGRKERETKKSRNPMPMPRQLWSHVQRKHRLKHNFFVQSHDGNQIGSIKNSWASAKKAAMEIAAKEGVVIDLTDVTPHTLKHTACTWSMQRGAAIYEAAAYFSNSVETFTKTYAHHHPEHQQSAVRAMEAK